MANNLKMELVQTILALHELRWSARRIARELGIDRETVHRHIRLAAAAGGRSNPATNLPTGSDGLVNLPGGWGGV